MKFNKKIMKKKSNFQNKQIKYQFTDQWLSGFAQSDGSFFVNIIKNRRGKMPYRPRALFVITQSLRELDIIVALQKHYKVGYLRKDSKCVYFVVESTVQLLSTIIPLFDANPVKGGKFGKYLIFRAIVFAIKKQIHLSPYGFLQILNACFFIHSLSSRTVEKNNKIVDATLELDKTIDYKNIKPLEIDSSVGRKQNQEDFTIDYVAGVVDGDGSIGFSFKANAKVIPIFSVTMATEDKSVLVGLAKFMGCGYIKKVTNKEAVSYSVEGLKSIRMFVEPVFKKLHLNTVKQTYLNNCFLVYAIISENNIKKKEHFEKVVDLVYNINQEGKYRKITKEKYLEKISSFLKDKK